MLLKKLTYENGLPLGKKEIEFIEQARKKRELETSLPPFTDEASLNLRKRLMEEQEMLEFKLRGKFNIVLPNAFIKTRFPFRRRK